MSASIPAGSAWPFLTWSAFIGIYPVSWTVGPFSKGIVGPAWRANFPNGFVPASAGRSRVVGRITSDYPLTAPNS